jgi:magnesium chelatase subunit I
MEFVLHGLSEFSLISKKGLEEGGYNFGDILGSMMNMNLGDIEEDEEEDF